MKPVFINLAIKKNIREKVFLAFVVMFASATFGITLVNIYEYTENTKVIKVYESKVKEINQRSERKRTAGQNMLSNKEEDEKLKQDLDYLSDIIKKNMFPLSMVMTEIEQVKPDKIDIHELVFSEDLKVVMIKGESDHVVSVSEFIRGMDRSKRFNIELSREEMKENQKIIFELNAKWISIENDPKI